MLGIPDETPYDLRFRLLGIPVRVHPLFWLIMAALRFSDARTTLLFVLCGFVSVLFHEYGHGLMSRVFGQRPSIILYGMGGLCTSPDRESERPLHRFLILICGPLAGYLLAAIAVGIAVAAESSGTRLGPTAREILGTLIEINIYWSTLNLVPIWPLDGGQIMEVILAKISASNGKRWAHVVSLLLAGVLAILAYERTGDPILTLFCAYFAYMNYRVLQQLHDYARYSQYRDY